MKNRRFRFLPALLPCIALAMISLHSCTLTEGHIGIGDNEEWVDSIFQNTDSLHVTSSPNEYLHVDYDFEFLKAENTVTDSINAGIEQMLLSGLRRTDMPHAIAEALAKEEEEMGQMMMETYEPDDESYGHIKHSAVRTGRFLEDATDSVVVYYGTSDIYLGGAHGSYITTFLNFSKRTGHLLTIEDVLDTTKEQGILDAMLRQLLKDRVCATREELMEKTSLLAFGELFLTPNFKLGKEGMTFCFGQYEIGPYSSGITYITLPYKVLAPFMKQESTEAATEDVE